MKKTQQQWSIAIANFLHPRVLTMLFLGLSAGIPILLIFSSLSLWLREAGVTRSAVTFFSWAALGYSFKFVWAPLIDRLPIPFLTRWLGRRRSWILTSQIAIILAILWMASIDPAQTDNALLLIAMAAVFLGFSSATQDIVIDAYRIEAADNDSQAAMSSTYIAGYRIGMLIAGAGALFLASYWGSTKEHYSYSAWQQAYSVMALSMLIGVLATLTIPEAHYFRRMKNTLPAGYLAALIALLFSCNEYFYWQALTPSSYHNSSVWGIRGLLITFSLWLLFSRSKNRHGQKNAFVNYASNDIIGLLLIPSVVATMVVFDLTNHLSHLNYLWIVFIMVSTLMIAYYIRSLMNTIDDSVKKVNHESISTPELVQIFIIFIAIVSSVIFTYQISSDIVVLLKSHLKDLLHNKALANLLIETPRLLLALASPFILTSLLIKAKIIQYQVLDTTYLQPIKEFFKRYGLKQAILLLLLISLYRISDIVLGIISNLFYQDLNFTKIEIASIVKTYGLFMTIAGGFLGGFLATRFGVMRILFLGALLSAFTNLLFMVLSSKGHDLQWLYIVISADNLSAGLASAAFVAFLSSLTNIQFTAVQYAIFSSLMTLLPKTVGGYSGSMVDNMGYNNFFLITAIMGIPVLFLIVYARKKLVIKEPVMKKG